MPLKDTTIGNYVPEEQTKHHKSVPPEKAAKARKGKAPTLTSGAVKKALVFILSEHEESREPTPTQVSKAVVVDSRRWEKPFPSWKSSPSLSDGEARVPESIHLPRNQGYGSWRRLMRRSCKKMIWQWTVSGEHVVSQIGSRRSWLDLRRLSECFPVVVMLPPTVRPKAGLENPGWTSRPQPCP